MPLETGSFINDLTVTNPPNSDPAGQGDDHLRLIKATVQGTFPQMGDIFSKVRRQDTAVSISSTWNTSHFLCSNSATATVVLTLPPAASITTGYHVDITTIGTGTVSVLPSGAASINGGASLSIPQLNTARLYYGGSSAWFADVHPVSPSAQLAGGSLSISGTSILNGALTVAGTTTLSGTVVLSNGQLKFPAAQNASADANTLDDYEEGTWTPVLTFGTPGNLSSSYTRQVGTYTKIGNRVTLTCTITTATFTHTTAAASARITGFPFTFGEDWGDCVMITGVIAGASTQISILSASGATLCEFNITTNTDGTNVIPGVSQFVTGTNKNVRFCSTFKV